jgi:hypothetical protein
MKMVAGWSGFGRSASAFALAALGALVSTPGPAEAQQVTFTKDVAPILHRSCAGCHRPGDVAPMTLLTYDDVRPWARAIKDRVVRRQMPPWFLDRHIGIQKYKNDPSLSEDEIATIAKWVDQGAPRGNPADMPPVPQFSAADGSWDIGKPDLVVRYPPYTVPATGPDLYLSLYAPFGTTEDRYIKAIQSRPVGDASRKVVHHALSYAVDPGLDDPSSNPDDPLAADQQFLVEYASGKRGEVYPPDTGVLLKAGQNARVSYHLHSIGEEVKAEFELGVVLYPKGEEPKHVRWSKQLAHHQTALDLAPGEITRVDGYERLNKAAVITAFQPHMHIRGKHQCLELIYPGQPVRTETVTCVAWDYNWHTIYNYADDVAPIVPAGTLLHVISWMDNSPANKFNPDPKNWVGDGGRTIDEMAFAWIGWYDLTDEEYKEKLAERKAQRSRSTN